MKEPIDDGGPAFMIPGGGCLATGVTLRDYFAAAALPTMMASWERWNRIDNHKQTFSDKLAELVAIDCYEQADAMIAARKEGA
jgi:hypothetical protein